MSPADRVPAKRTPPAVGPSPHRRAARRRLRHLAVTTILLGSLALGACARDADGPRGTSGSALWVADSGPGLDGDTVERLAGAGIEGVFLEAGRLSWSGSRPKIERLPLPRLPPRSAVILAVEGIWKPGAADAETLAGDLQRELTSLAFVVEDEGYVVEGFLLDLDPGQDLDRYTAVLDAIRRARQDRRSLAAAVSGRRLARGAGDASLAKLASSVDFLVAWLYGQRPEGVSRDEAWDLGAVDAGLGVLESLGVPYLVGVVTLNHIEHRSAGGEVLARRTIGRLGRLALDRRLELEPGFVLLGLDCRRYDFAARTAFDLDGWRVRPGETVRAQGLSYAYLAELQRRLAARSLEHHRGELYLRLPAPGEDLTPSLETLLASLTGGVPSPELEAVVEPVAGGRYRARVRHVGIRTSELVFVDANFLDVELEGGTFVHVDAGGFERYQMLRHRADGGTEVSLHGATLLRLYRPILEPGDEVSTGAIEIRTTGGRVSLRPLPTFLLPDGSVMGASATPWPAPSETPE